MRCSGAADPYYGLDYVPGTLTVKARFSLVFRGALTYANSGAVTAGSLKLHPSSGVVTSVSGKITVPGSSGGTATVDVNIARVRGRYVGTIAVSDPSARLSTVAHLRHTKLVRTASGEVTGTALGTRGSASYTLQFTV